MAHFFRLSELEKVLGISRDSVRGWLQRGLFRYEGRERGPGVDKLYSSQDATLLVVATRMVQAGVEPRVAWTAIYDSRKHLDDGSVQYLAVAPAEYGFEYWAVSDVASLLRIFEPYGRRGPDVITVVAVGLIRAEVERRLREYLEDDAK